MTDISRLFDSYNRHARLYPALLILLPPTLMFIGWLPAALDVGKTILSVAAACGLLYLLADYARTRGKRLEPKLIEEWGGWPTTLWLRHLDSHLSGDVKRRYHSFLGKQPGIGTLPTQAEEQVNPREADQRYEAAVLWLKEQCRGPKYPLVEKENATYGFRRNLLGLRTTGLAIAIMTLAFPIVTALLLKQPSRQEMASVVLNAYLNAPGGVQGAAVFALLATVTLVLVVSRKWVREAGDQYARALLSCCDTLQGQVPDGGLQSGNSCLPKRGRIQVDG
jgi:hypothetical protein